MHQVGLFLYGKTAPEEGDWELLGPMLPARALEDTVQAFVSGSAFGERFAPQCRNRLMQKLQAKRMVRLGPGMH